MSYFHPLDTHTGAKSELRVNSVNFEVGDNEQIIRGKQRPLILKGQSLIRVKIFS